MSTVFITGSTDGIGLAAAKDLVADGHTVIGHARNEVRADSLRRTVPGIHDVVVGDAASFEDIKRVAAEVTSLGQLDVVIHNVGVGYREPRRITTVDGHAHVLQINVLAPYLLTALMPKPARMIWTSSGLHRSGEASVEDIDWRRRSWNGFQAYSDSKLFDAALAFAVARRWPETQSNALEPGWVATKMGGAGAPDDLAQAHVTQVWLAEAAEAAARTSGDYFFHQKRAPFHPAVDDFTFQDELLAACADLTGVTLPN